METNGVQIIKDAFKTPIGIIIGYIIASLAIIGSIFWKDYRMKNEIPEPINLTTNGAIGIETEQYAYLNIQGLTDEVAISGYYPENKDSSENDRYYIAFNEGYMYIVDLNFETIELLKPWQQYFYSERENVQVPEPVTIYGMTESIPSELKYMVLGYYNESVSKEQQITISDFENYFGSVLLNVRKEPVDTELQRLIIIFSAIILIFIFTTHMEIYIQKRKVKKYLKRNNYEDDIISQLDNLIEEKYYKDKIILTKDFFLDLNKNKSVIFKFSDVKWIHIHQVEHAIAELTVYLKDGKTKLSCLNIKGLVTNEFLEISNKIFDKVSSDCLKGYTQENVMAFAQYKNELKKDNI